MSTVICITCGGTGKVFGGGYMKVDCYSCQGLGKVTQAEKKELIVEEVKKKSNPFRDTYKGE